MALLAAGVLHGRLHGECVRLDDPFQVLDFYLEIDPADWEAVRQHHSRDEAEEFVERPARFHCGDEAPLPVRVRQKQGVGGPIRDNPDKFPLKIDFDDLVEDGEWHGRRKVVLENGGAEVFRAIFREGLGWQLLARAGMVVGAGGRVTFHEQEE